MNPLVIGNDLLAQHGLYSWKCKYNNDKSRVGLCNYSRETIYLSRDSAQHMTEYEIMQTLLHEVAHAIVGPGHGHGAVWLAKAREIGMVEGRTFERFLPVSYKYYGLCASGHKFFRHRMSKEARYCSKCGKVYGKFTPKTFIQFYDTGDINDRRIFAAKYGMQALKDFNLDNDSIVKSILRVPALV